MSMVYLHTNFCVACRFHCISFRDQIASEESSVQEG